jgi:benzoate membrane transport protein
LVSYLQQQLHWEQAQLSVAMPIFTTPEFRWQALLALGLPLFIVTMASQNMPGIAALQAHGYGGVPISKLLAFSAGLTLLLAPFGAFMLNLAAITAAICMNAHAHADPDKRYTAAVVAGFAYLFLGIFGGGIASLLLTFPIALIQGIAGIALLGTIGNGLAQALQNDSEREPALMAFLVTLSGVKFAGIGSAFWGVVVGALALFIMQRSKGPSSGV